MNDVRDRGNAIHDIGRSLDVQLLNELLSEFRARSVGPAAATYWRLTR